MTRRTRVYVAGPINSSGIVTQNIRLALRTADILLMRGYAPYVPHLNCLWDIAFQQETEVWLALDKEFLRCCDALLRIPGTSKGADSEMMWALDFRIPIYLSLDQLCACEKPTREE